jgi:hypothetical protein
VPQPIYKMPLQDVPEEGLVGIEPAKLIEWVITGPSQHPLAFFEAFVDLLNSVGVPDAAARVFVSGIPLRQ